MSTEGEEVITGLGALEVRVGALEARFDTLSADLAENTASTMRVEENTSDLVEAMKAISWVGKIAKPASYVAAFTASVAAFWVSFKAGIGPK